MSEVANYATINLPSNAYTTISGSSDTINAGRGSYLFVNGSHNTVNTGNSSYIYLNGSSDVLNMGSFGQADLLEGTGIKVTVNSGNVDLGSDVTGVVLWGSYDWVHLAPGAEMNIHGILDGVFAADGDAVGLTAGSGGDAVSLNSGVLQLVADVYDVVLTGSGDAVALGSSDSIEFSGNFILASVTQFDSVTLAGSDDLINGDDAYVTVGGSDNTLSLSSSRIFADPGISNLSLVGSNDFIDDAGIFIVPSFVSESIDGNSNSIGVGSDSVVYVTGNNNVLNFSGAGGVLDIDLADDTNIFESSGQINISDSGSTTITGDSNVVNLLDSGATVSISGSSNTIYAGANDSVTLDQSVNIICMSGGSITLAADISTTIFGADDNIYGSNLTIYSYDAINSTINGSANTIQLDGGTAQSVYLSGQSNLVYMSVPGDTVYINPGSTAVIDGSSSTDDFIDLYADTSATFTGNYNVFNLLDQGAAVSISGSSNTIYAGANDSVTLDQSVNIVCMSGGSITLATGISTTVFGAEDNIYGSNLTIYSYDAINSTINGSANTIQLDGGTAQSVYLSGQSDLVYTGASGDTVYMNPNATAEIVGSSSTIDFMDNGFGASADITGNNDTINAGFGDTIELNPNDSGDVINMIGGTIVLDSLVSNITINGTGDVLEGADAGDAGINSVSYIQHVGQGGTLITQTIYNTFAIQYSAGNIQDLVNYFEANPNLSENEIVAAESDSNYQSNLQNYLYSADIYGGSSPIPPNVVAMLEGYSSTYVALLGVNTSILAEETYIESQFAWGGNNAPVPDDGLVSMLQNLTPALEDTNGATELDVTDALACLQDASGSGTSQGNVVVMDTAAKLLLEMAEQPDDDKSPPLTDPNYINLPGLTGPYAITVQPGEPFGDAGTNELINLKNEDGGAWGEFVSDFEAYGGPILDIAAIITANPELIALSTISSLIAVPIEVASVAYNIAQGGVEISQGDDVEGVFAVLSAIGNGLQDMGGSVAQLGADLASGVAVVQGAYDIDLSSEQGNILSAITSAFEAVGGAAGLAQDNKVPEAAELGEGLSAAGQAGESESNVLQALTSLVEAASAFQQLGGVSGIENDFASAWASFQENENSSIDAQYAQGVEINLGIGSPALPNDGGDLVGSDMNPGSIVPENLVVPFVSSNGNFGLNEFSPTSGTDSSQYNVVENLPSVALSLGSLGVSPDTSLYIIAGHGSEDNIGAPDDITENSADQYANTLLQNPLSNYTPGESVVLLSCNVGSYAGRLIQYSGSISSVAPNFAQILADALGVDVFAPNNYIWFFPASDPQPGVPGYSYGIYGETTNKAGALVPNYNDPGKMVEYFPQHGYIIPPSLNPNSP